VFTRCSALALAGLVTVAGCSSDPAGPAPSPDAASTAPAGSVGTGSGDVLGQYLAALSTGDVATANSLRCAQGRLPDASLPTFEAATKGLRDALGGSFNVTGVQQVDPITLASLSGAKPDAQVAFALAGSAGNSSMIAVAVVTEDGQQRLCGEMQEGAPGVMDRVQKAEFTPVLAQVPSLSVGIPTDPSPGAVQAEDRALTDLSQLTGATEGYTRAWRLADGSGLRITALRAENFQGAITLARASLAASGLDAAEYLSGLPSGFVGVSEVADAWTWAHPASIGLRSDRAAGVVNDTAFVVEVSGVVAGKGHQQITDAVTSLDLG
jgi:hypothetical protein